MNISPKDHTFLIVDDHATIRTGLLYILKTLGYKQEQFTEAASLIEAEKKSSVMKHTHVFLDLHFKDSNSLGLIPKLVSQHSKVFLYTQSDSPIMLQNALKLGVHSIFTKDMELTDLTSQIEKSIQGMNIFPASLKESLMGLQQFSPRELEVANLIATGLSNKEIAEKLNCSDQTIKTHRANILKKIGAENSVEAAVWLVQKGYLSKSTSLSKDI